MNKFKIIGLLIWTALSCSLTAQSEASTKILVKTNPLRFIYGLNGELTFQTKQRHLISLTYQDHQRDFFTIIRDPIAGLPTLPYLENANGYTGYISYQFPIGDPSEVKLWAGPKLGQKEVSHFSSSSDLSGLNNTVFIDQRNRYYLAQLTLRNNIGQFVIEAYIHAGLVNIQWEGTFFDNDGNIDYIDDDWENYWLPHGLFGFSVGYEF